MWGIEKLVMPCGWGSRTGHAAAQWSLINPRKGPCTAALSGLTFATQACFCSLKFLLTIKLLSKNLPFCSQNSFFKFSRWWIWKPLVRVALVAVDCWNLNSSQDALQRQESLRSTQGALLSPLISGTCVALGHSYGIEDKLCRGIWAELSTS